MATKVVLKRVHLAATTWFTACAGYLVAVSLHQAGLKWWLVLSLSGYSTGMLLLLVCLYLFAFFRGIQGTRRSAIEHPLTSTDYYMFLYVSTPLLAGLVFAAGTESDPGTSGYLIHIAMGTLKATFVAWIVIDPLVGIMEMDLPASRNHRAERLARTRQCSRLMEKTASREGGTSSHL